MFKNEGSNESNLIFRIVYNFLPESVALLDTLYEYIEINISIAVPKII